MKSAVIVDMSVIFARKMAKAPVFTFPELLVERNFIFGCLVEAPGLEPGSKEGSAKASTSVSCILILGPSSPTGGILRPQFVGCPRQSTNMK